MKADLHLHSRFSDRAPEWLFRRAGLPDSYSDPRELYEELRRGGFDFFTLTDHNRIEGCLEVADRPGVFISEQVSAAFPEDRCAVQLLVWGLNEAQHVEIQALRREPLRFAALSRRAATRACRGPSIASGRRTIWRLALSETAPAFPAFRRAQWLAGQAGERSGATFIPRGMPHSCDCWRNSPTATTSRPTHEEPWRKVLTGGSDDHGGMFAGSAWTEVPFAAGVPEFLGHLREGRCEPAGRGGTPLALSHGLYNNLRQFIGQKFAGAESSSLIGKAFSRFMEGNDPTEFSWMEKFGFVAQGIATGKIFELVKPANASLWKQLSATCAQADIKALLTEETAGLAEPERRAFAIANFFANQLAFRFFTSFVHQLSSGNIIEAIRELSTLLPILATLAPYVYALTRARRQTANELSELSSGSLARRPAAPALQNHKRAWFTDTLEDVNGVANTIRRLTAACVGEGLRS